MVMQALTLQAAVQAGAQRCAAQRPPAAAAAACLLRGSPAQQLQRPPAAAAARRQQRRAGGARLAVHSSSTLTYGAEWSTPKDAYLTVGLSHCYAKDDSGKLVDKFVIEPITANSIECMAAGAKTSFMHVFSLRLEEALARDKAALPAEFGPGTWCDEYEARCDACARTWLRPHAMDNLLDIVPLGQLKSSFNFSTADKRVLNMENEVDDSDNIKQDLSIDVYGRKAKEEAAEKLAADKAVSAAAAKGGEEEEADDMDALLSV